MPKRVRAHQLEELSRNRLHCAFEKAGWTVENLAKDYGEDLLVRIFENGNTTPLYFFVQSKATDSLSRYEGKNPDFLWYRLRSEHLIHWEKFQQPVILTLWDSRTNNTYWTCIQNALVQIRFTCDLEKRKTVRIPIYRGDLLNGQGLNRIRKIAHSRYARMEYEKEGVAFLIDRLQSKLNEKIEYSTGSVIIEEANSPPEIIFFDNTFERIQKLATIRNVSAEEIVEFAIEEFLKDISDHKLTGKFPVRNQITGKVTHKRMGNEQLKYYLQRQLEEIGFD